ncbi:unnamed protein product, partial [Effrenium voratum]
GGWTWPIPMAPAQCNIGLCSDLARMLQKCQKKISKGLHPGEELAMVEQLRRLRRAKRPETPRGPGGLGRPCFQLRSLAEDLATHSRSSAWHYLLQELMLTQQVLEGKCAGLKAALPRATFDSPGELRKTPLAAWHSAVPDDPAVSSTGSAACDEKEPHSLVGDILAEACR